MKKIITIVGTRPELIRLSEIIKKLDIFTEHIFVHTGQNYTPEMHDQFFIDLWVRRPDYQLNIENPLSGIPFIGYMLQEVEKIIVEEKPDSCLILGDTNSALSSYVCKKYNIPVFHMEAGNRCYSDEVPEEMNRKIVDSLSAYLLPYTQRSRELLLLEGYHPSRVIVTWNPITEVMYAHLKESKKPSDYVLVTLHRTENVTDESRLKSITDALNTISEKYKILLSVHPKLASMLEKFQIELAPNIQKDAPYAFQEFLHLEQGALCVITDSGTVPEECAILGTPCVMMRNSTERPELLESNAMLLSGTKTDEILSSFEIARTMDVWPAPLDYQDRHVSDKIIKLLMRHISF
jgi:UDP-N-acetylglucosamine 2-epimerase